MRSVERREISLAVPGEHVLALLEDYALFGEWFPGVRTATVLVREGDIAVIEAEGDTAMTPSPSNVFEIVRTGPREFVFTQVGLFREQGVSGRCRVEECGDGTESVLRVEVVLKTRGFAFGKARLLRGYLQRFSAAVVERARKAASGALRPSRRKVLEVRRMGAMVEIWYRGTTFLFSRPSQRGPGA